jgi:hypothetical protein
MKIFMYDHFPNYGDVLNKHIWNRYVGTYLAQHDDMLMFGIGTLLGQNIEHTGQVIVCGSGCGYEPDVSAVAAYKIFWVRGPHSARLLGLPADMAITDPAILVDECFPATTRGDRVVFMPHWETAQNPLWRRVCAKADIDYIDPLADVAKISAQLSSAKLVIAEAMHGAIVADAYRVPWIPVATSARVNLFKWHDWAASLNVKPVFHSLAPLGMSDVFRSFTGDAQTADKLRTDIHGSADIPLTATDSFAARCGHGVNRAYTMLLPRWQRYKIEHRLLMKIGPRLDAWADQALAAGKQSKRLEKAAAELRRLAQSPGCLSDDVIFATQKARVKARLGDVQVYLAAAAQNRAAARNP